MDIAQQFEKLDLQPLIKFRFFLKKDSKSLTTAPTNQSSKKQTHIFARHTQISKQQKLE